MKWVIVGLVLVNLGFFGWQAARDREVVAALEAPTPAATPALVGRLLLVSEVEPGVLRRRRSSPLTTASTRPEPPATVAVATPAVEPAAGTEGSPDTAPVAPTIAGLQCYTVGPLDNEDDISALAAWFHSQGSEATLRDDERREVASTWVFMPPQTSRADADVLAAEMKAANIEDIYVIPRGDMANAISLGLYSQPETLNRRVTQLRSRGFEPSVQPRYRTATASWFDVTTTVDQPMTVGVLDQIFPDLVIREVACGDGAPGAQEGPIAGDPAIPYNSSDLRQDQSYSGNAPSAASEAPGRSGTQ